MLRAVFVAVKARQAMGFPFSHWSAHAGESFGSLTSRCRNFRHVCAGILSVLLFALRCLGSFVSSRGGARHSPARRHPAMGKRPLPSCSEGGGGGCSRVGDFFTLRSRLEILDKLDGLHSRRSAPRRIGEDSRCREGSDSFGVGAYSRTILLRPPSLNELRRHDAEFRPTPPPPAPPTRQFIFTKRDCPANSILGLGCEY